MALAWASRSTVWAQDAGVPSRSPEPELEVSELDQSGETDSSATLSLKSWRTRAAYFSSLGLTSISLKVKGVNSTWSLRQLPIPTSWD